MKKCIDPLWESKSDYQIFSMLAQRLGREQDYTEGNSEIDWARKFFEISDLPQRISWEEFDRKGYYIVNVPEDYRSTPALRWYAEGRACDTPDPSNPKRLTDKGHELGTDSGKIEFLSRAPAGAALSAELGRTPYRAGGEISSAPDFTASPVQFPHALRQTCRLARRYSRASCAKGWIRVVAGAHSSK
jgi:anaerobic selenocysteine-containing dehydrogenase